MDNKLVMILERSSENMKITEKNNDNYILEGIFTVFDEENDNHRIYEKKEFLPHYEKLKKVIEGGTLYGELDHPETFDIALKNVSHIIESLQYNSDRNNITGRIKILDTHQGKNAKAIIDGGGSLYISSRAAGVVNENKKVSIKGVFTYDLVYKGGFSSSKQIRVNESLGFEDSEEFCLLDGTCFPDHDSVLKEIEKNENLNNIYNNKIKSISMNEENLVTQEHLNIYSKHIQDQYVQLDKKLNELSESSGSTIIKEEINEIKNSIKAINEEVINSKFVSYEEKIENIVNFVNELSITLNKGLNHNDYIAERVNLFNEQQEKIKEFQDYLAINLDKGLNHNDYITNKIDEVIYHQDYLAENLNNGLNHNDYLAEKYNYGLNHQDYLAEKLNQGLNHNDYVVEQMNESKKNKKSNPILEKKNILNESLNVDRKDRMELLNNRISTIIDGVQKQRNTIVEQQLSFPYLTLLNENNKKRFMLMDKQNQKLVMEQINKAKPVSEGAFLQLWENVSNPRDVKKINERLIALIPENLKPAWDALGSIKQQSLLEQSTWFDCSSDEQIKFFWSTRQNLRSINETLKTGLLNESKNENMTVQSANKSFVELIGNSLDKYK